MRIAFISPEYITEQTNAGGLGNYLHRMAQLLVEAGHEVEVFVLSESTPHIIHHQGVRIERVRSIRVPLIRIPTLVLSYLLLGGFHGDYLLKAWAIAKAFKRRHKKAPFNLLQSPDLQALAFFIPKLKNCTHVIRCSHAFRPYYGHDGIGQWALRWFVKLETATLRKADFVYAPSRFIADYYKTEHGISVDVIRPPLNQETLSQTNTQVGLPSRFLLHFGQLHPRKGTLWLARALKVAFSKDPTLTIVIIGTQSHRDILRPFEELEAFRSRVLLLYPLPKKHLYAIMHKADAVILPSLVDNLPNTAIESLMLGLPIIGTKGASIDELVEQGVHGELVEANDDISLANAILKVWQGKSAVRKGFKWNHPVTPEMKPENAMAKLLELAKKTCHQKTG